MINWLKTCLKEKNYEKIFEITMRDSNNFHAVCRDTFPSICYMNDNSNFIVKVVDAINSFSKKIIVFPK
jgi:diphosphomevalonate decarboxylase